MSRPTTAFVAKFKDGQVLTRNSHHDYRYAWAIIHEDGSVKQSGFSRDYVQANTAANRADAWPKGWTDAKRYTATRSVLAVTRRRAKEAGVTVAEYASDRAAMYQAYEKALRVEIVTLTVVHHVKGAQNEL